MNGNNINDSRRDDSTVEIAKVTCKVFDEPKEFERRRKVVEEAKKLILNAQKV